MVGGRRRDELGIAPHRKFIGDGVCLLVLNDSISAAHRALQTQLWSGKPAAMKVGYNDSPIRVVFMGNLLHFRARAYCNRAPVFARQSDTTKVDKWYHTFGRQAE
jgi:hypothetical protein